MNISRRITCSLLVATHALLCACGSGTAPTAPPEAPEAGADGHEASGLELAAAARTKLGIVVATVAAGEYSQQIAGYGLVLSHDAIAQAVADVATAQAAQTQSRAALARVQGLAGTPGAFPAETLETAQRQAAADGAALTLAERKLSAAFGQNQPWRTDRTGAVLEGLASGTVKIVRATFPLGTLTGALPRSLRILRPDPTGSGQQWTSSTVWAAPADTSIPGRSLFALLDDSTGDIGEGERLDVRASRGAGEPGVVIPRSAVVASDGGYWCFLETGADTFERVTVATDRPVDAGYFLTSGVTAGSRVVTNGAGLLLALERSPPAEEEE
jgi:hypothetical protein